MKVTERIAKLSQELPPEKQEEVLKFVEFLISRQAHKAWTMERRRTVAARTMGCLAGTHTSSEAFALRKKEEKTKEQRRWKP